MARAVVESFISNPETITFQVHYYPDFGKDYVKNIDIVAAAEIDKQLLIDLITDNLEKANELQTKADELAKEFIGFEIELPQK